MTQRWSAHFGFHWTPFVAFAQRRAELANWIDKNVEAKGVLDHKDLLGVAISDPDLRVTVSRTGFDISLGKAGLTVEPLADFIRGAVDTVSPSDIHIASASMTHSVPLEGDYDELRAAFASRLLATSQNSRFQPIDASVLIDLNSETGTLQAEYGIVTDDELRSRLENPSIGRIKGTRAAGKREELEGSSAITPVGLFCDSRWLTSAHAPMPASDAPEDTWAYVRSVTEQVENECTTLAKSIAEAFAAEGGVNEYSCGA